jgi:hypothetical protein
MEDYPKTLLDLEERFSTEEACRGYRLMQQAVAIKPVPIKDIHGGTSS